MKLSELEYQLPKELIAHEPITLRDHSKLMVIRRNPTLEEENITHKHFYDLINILTPHDVLVFNQTKVFPAKFGKILLLRQIKPLVWECYVKGKIQNITFEKEPQGTVPLPPYIHSTMSEKQLQKRYQTVYAKEGGSVAAPTAGFHFTNKLLKQLKQKGVQMEFVTLHVGPGTFLPIRVDDLTKHEMHTEYFSLESQTASRLNKAKSEGKRIITVGTTTTRVLESCATPNAHKSCHLTAKSSKTNIFIYPPYKFKFIDGLITNFHLPHSTLIALIYAFGGEKLMKEAYEQAIQNKYRFYSFGDSSIIL